MPPPRPPGSRHVNMKKETKIRIVKIKDLAEQDSTEINPKVELARKARARTTIIMRGTILGTQE